MKRPTRYELWYGRDEAPAPRLVLHAGPVSAILDGPDLRHVSVGDVELVQRVYVAVRDAPWNTIPAIYTDWNYELGADRFRVSFRASHRYEDIDFAWAGVITGTPEGSIGYEMDGRCRGVFQYSKIGFNVHHALDGSVGHHFRAQTEEGELEGILPHEIDPQRVVDGTLSGMFEPYSELAIEVTDELEAMIHLEGDLLELQDHRNWSDANFKSYGTPLRLGFPFDSSDGQRIRQLLTISYAGPTPAPATRPDPEVRISASPAGRLPPIGLGMASHGEPLSSREAELLQTLRPAHLRVDLRPADADIAAVLERAAAAAASLNSALELAVHTNMSQADALRELAHIIGASEPRIARVLVYPVADGFSAFVSTTPAEIVSLVREHLEAVVGDVIFAGGTDQSFADINRDRPTDPALTGLCFALSPTVHAADDWSIVENIAGQSEVVRMARSLPGERPVCISPVTLATRFGPYPAGPSLEGSLPAAVDVRQASLLGAAWTVGSIAALAGAGTTSATYYETTGWRGVIERDGGSPMAAFPSEPGQAFPLFHVLADAAEWADADLLEAASSDPLRVVVLACRDTAGRHVLVANVTPEPQRVVIDGLTGPARVRMLDEATAPLAVVDPERYRSAATAALTEDPAGRWLVGLGPFAIARIDETQ